MNITVENTIEAVRHTEETSPKSGVRLVDPKWELIRDAELPFSPEYIAQKLDWDLDFSRQTIAEYKKFLYVIATSHAEVTPSRLVDEVWHLHILHTQKYMEYCNEIFGSYLHHNPGGLVVEGESSVFDRQYRDTMTAYEASFGEAPPAAVWGKPKPPKLSELLLVM